MATVNHERLLLTEDLNAINTRLHHYQVVASQLKQVIVEYNKFDLDPFEPEILNQLLADPIAFVREQCLSRIEVPAIGGFKMKREALLDSLDLPDMNPLQKAVETIKKYNLTPGAYFDLPGDFIITDGEVSTKEEVRKAIAEGFRLYAEKPNELEAADAYIAFINAWRKLDKMLRSRHAQRLQNQHVNQYLNVLGEEVDFREDFYRQLI